MAGSFLLGLLLCACPGPPPTSDGGTDGGSGPLAPIELGTTDSSGNFVALTGEAFATPGAQGGFHVNTFFRLPEGGVGDVYFHYRVVRARDDKLVSTGSRKFNLGLFRVSTWTNPEPVTVFMCPTPVGIDIIGEELVFTVWASTVVETERLAEGTAKVIFRCGPSGGSYCDSICKG